MKARLYWVLFAVESVCAAAVLYSGVPLYRALLKGPGPDEPAHEVLLKTAIAVVLMQASYWSRRRVRPAGLKRRVLLAHLLMFTSRLSFVFAGSLLSLVVFVRSGDTKLSADGIASCSPGYSPSSATAGSWKRWPRRSSRDHRTRSGAKPP
jgi:hypothetical protein